MSGFFRYATLLAATISTGLVAGLFYAFAVAVMPGLGKVDDRSYIATMQSINRVIINGWFISMFVGMLAFAALAGLLNLDGRHGPRRTVLLWIVAAFVLSLLTWVVTMAFNVPLNDDLEAAGDPDHIKNLTAAREHFEVSWVRWHVVRTLTSTAAFGCLSWALVLYGRATGKGGT